MGWLPALVLLAACAGPPELPTRYGVPEIDLTADTDRRSVVDQDTAQYLGHPSTVLLEDGRTMLLAYPEGHGRGAVVYRRSHDAGRTWSDRLPVPDNWSTSQEVPTLYRVVDPNGVRRVIMFSGLYPIRMAVSEDDGGYWSALEPIGDFGGIVAMSSVERLKDGSYMAFFHDDGRFFAEGGEAGQFRVYTTASDDGGLTWSAPREILTHPDLDLCEPGVVRSPDGDELAMLLRENSRASGRSFVSFSQDEGQTWSEPQLLPEALTGDRHTLRYLTDGSLLVVFRDMGTDETTRGDWLSWIGSYEDLHAQEPAGTRLRLMDNTNPWDSTYPGVEVLPNGDVVTTTYGHWGEGLPPYIVSIRLTAEELAGYSTGRQ